MRLSATRRGTISTGRGLEDRLYDLAGALPSLDLQFANQKVLDSRVSFARATTGTYVGSDGVIKSAAVNEPRFDHSTTTGESLGLLVEEQRTNLIRNNTGVGTVAGTPGTLPTNWSLSGGGVGTLTQQVVGTGVDKGITYFDIRYSGTSSSTGVRIFTEVTGISAAASGQTWTATAYLAILPGAVNFSGITNDVVERNVGGSIVQTTTGVNITTASSTMSRFSTSRILTDATTASVQQALTLVWPTASSIDFTLRIGLPQLEQGAFATSVIPTSTAATTRAADVVQITGTNFSSWYNQSEGTVFTEYSGRTGGRVFMTDDGAANNRFEVRISGNTSQFNSWSTGIQDVAGLYAPAATGLVDGVTVKTAIVLKVNDAAISTNGAAVGTDTSCAMPVALNKMFLGSFQGSATFLNGPIKRLTYWPQRLSSATLQALTQ